MRHALIAGALLVTAGAQAHTVVLYSRADAQRALHLHQLASVYGPAVIDRHIAPGAYWRQVMAQAICSADVVLVLWSARAAVSVELGAEWRLAAACAPRLIPVLLDSTPMPGELGMRQAVDWR